MNMIWNDKNRQRSGNSDESGMQQNNWEESTEFMGAEMKPFVALMEEIIPANQITQVFRPKSASTLDNNLATA